MTNNSSSFAATGGGDGRVKIWSTTAVFQKTKKNNTRHTRRWGTAQNGDKDDEDDSRWDAGDKQQVRVKYWNSFLTVYPPPHATYAATTPRVTRPTPAQTLTPTLSTSSTPPLPPKAR